MYLRHFCPLNYLCFFGGTQVKKKNDNKNVLRLILVIYREPEKY